MFRARNEQFPDSTTSLMRKTTLFSIPLQALLKIPLTRLCIAIELKIIVGKLMIESALTLFTIHSVLTVRSTGVRNH